MALTNPTAAPLPFRLKSERQRLELLRRINAAELAELRADIERAATKVLNTPANSEGARTVQVISDGLRTGAIRLQPSPMPRARSLTPDQFLLHPEAGKPVLRVVPGSGDPVQGNTSPRWVGVDLASKPDQPAHWSSAPHPHKPPALTPYERRAVLGIVAIYLLAFAGLAAVTLWARAA